MREAKPKEKDEANKLKAVSSLSNVSETQLDVLVERKM